MQGQSETNPELDTMETIGSCIGTRTHNLLWLDKDPGYRLHTDKLALETTL